MSSARRTSGNVFAALSLQREGEQREDDVLMAQRLADPQARFLVVDPQARTLAQPAGLRLLDPVQCAALLPRSRPTYLGGNGAGPHFMVTATQDQAEQLTLALSATWLDLRSAGLAWPAAQSGLFAYAAGLMHWQQRTQYCSRCGGRLRLLAAGHRARCDTPSCSLDVYPRVDPAIIVIVSQGDHCLLGRQASWPVGRYSTLAGFVEPGESIEDAVAREVHEEAGVHVIDCDYHSSQPWPFPSSLMLGFVAEARDRHIEVGPELEDARWFSAGGLVDALQGGQVSIPPPLSVSWRLIEHWLRATAGIELSSLSSGVD